MARDIGKARLGGRMDAWVQYFDLANTISQSQYNVLNTRFGVVYKKFEVMFGGRNLSGESISPMPMTLVHPPGQPEKWCEPERTFGRC
jgi:hypothetical protein